MTNHRRVARLLVTVLVLLFTLTTISVAADAPKVNINEASFKEVLSLPYIDYELTKMIFNYKREVAEIQSIEDLKKIDGFPLDKFNRIALYLRAK